MDLCLHSMQVIMTVLLEISFSWQDSIVSEPAGMGGLHWHKQCTTLLLWIHKSHYWQTECEKWSTRTWQSDRNVVKCSCGEEYNKTLLGRHYAMTIEKQRTIPVMPSHNCWALCYHHSKNTHKHTSVTTDLRKMKGGRLKYQPDTESNASLTRCL